MPRVLHCVEWNDATQTCATETWVEQGALFVNYLPTVDQAQAVGGAMFAACCVLAAMSLFLPPSQQPEGN